MESTIVELSAAIALIFAGVVYIIFNVQSMHLRTGEHTLIVQVHWGANTISFNVNPITPTASYLMHSFLKPLNHQHYQNFADRPVAHSLPRAFRRLIGIFSTPVKHLLQVEVHVSELLSNKHFFVSNISTWTLAMFTQRCTNSFFPCSDNDPCSHKCTKTTH